MKGRNSIKFSIFWNLIIGFISSSIIITAFISKDKLVECEWFGVAIIAGILFAYFKYILNELNYLKEEIKKLKEKYNT